MKVLILAGGLGSRLSEETTLKPKPMVEIGGKPILWHIMKIYSHYGFNEFVILCGYKGYLIKEFFAHYFLHTSDLTIDMQTNTITHHNSHAEPWKVTLIDTGIDTMTGGRIKKVKKYIENEPFMLTYGDGVGDVDILELIKCHQNHGKAITMTSVQPEGRYGSLVLNNKQQVTSFQEKPKGDGSWVNAGFFVMNQEIFGLIPDDYTSLENGPMEQLAAQNNLIAFKHKGFWQSMDTLRDKNLLEELWKSNRAPWKVW